MKNKIKKIFLFIIMIGTIGVVLTGYTKLYNSQKISTSANINNYEKDNGDLLAAVTSTVKGECNCDKKSLSSGKDCSSCDSAKSTLENKCNGTIGTITYECYYGTNTSKVGKSDEKAKTACDQLGIANGKYTVNYSATCTATTWLSERKNILINTDLTLTGDTDWCSFSDTKASVKTGVYSGATLTTKAHSCIFRATKTGTYYAYDKSGSNAYKYTIVVSDNSIITPSTLTATFVPNGGKLSATDDICTLENNKDSCKVTFPKVTTPPSGKKLSGWSLDSCNTIRWKATETSGVILDHITITACWSNISSSTVPKTQEVKTPIPVTTTVNKYYWVGNYSKISVAGATVSCGDFVKVTTCTVDAANQMSTCNIESLNFIKLSGTNTVYSNVLSEGSGKEPTCPSIKRYSVKSGTPYYTSISEIPTSDSANSGAKTLPCNTEITFNKKVANACIYGSVVPNATETFGKQYCEATFMNNGKSETIYVDRTKLTTTKQPESICEIEIKPDPTEEPDPIEKEPVCSSLEQPFSNQKSTNEINLPICYTYEKGKLKADRFDEKNIFTCSKGYYRTIKENYQGNSCKNLEYSTDKQICYKVFTYSCTPTARPKVQGTGSLATAEGIGTISIKGTDSSTNTGLKGYIINNGEGVTHDSKWETFENSEHIASVQRHAGHHFAWVMTNDRSISYPIMLRIYSDDVSTTAEITAKGPNDDLTHTLKPLKTDDGLAYLDGVTSQGYVRLSNQLMNDSLIATGFDLFTTAYELTVESDKIALYATLTNSDSKYVEGYEPRTIDLDYGRNVAIIKIENSKGAQRSYTFIINRTDTRESINALKDVTLSVGKINFDPYVSDYTVSIPKNTKSVNINGTLESDKSAFITGYEPRSITINEDITSAVLKTISEAGITRNYVFTFIKTGAEEELNISNSTYLSSLTIPGTEIAFERETLSYTVAVEYETEIIPVYAFAESENAIVEINGNIGLKVGANKIEIIVTNGSVTKIYNVFINRKEDGLGVSSNTKLETLTVKDYDIKFSPDVEDYILKIKREKTLLLTATPASNRSEVYMYGNNDLTAFSTVRVKVIAENGDTGLYSVDIIKDVYNKQLETTVAIVGSIIILGGGIIIMVNKKRKKLQDYIEE